MNSLIKNTDYIFKERIFLKVKSILTKSIAVAALTTAGVAALNLGNVDGTQAAIVRNDASVYHVSQATSVYNNYENGATTGQVLAANTNWKIIKTAYDHQGNKWYDLGKNQWVKVVKTAGQAGQKTVNYNSVANTAAQTQTKTYTTHYGHSTYVSHASGSEASAKAWIASRESGGSYSARNGQYVGKYQLSAAYLHGDYSAANQERVADNYVKGRYGSWTAAQAFWQAHGWY